MTTTRKQYSPQFKARVAMDWDRSSRSTRCRLPSGARRRSINCRSCSLTGGPASPPATAETDALYQEIGRLKVELDWLQKKSACSTGELCLLVDRDHP